MKLKNVTALDRRPFSKIEVNCVLGNDPYKMAFVLITEQSTDNIQTEAGPWEEKQEQINLHIEQKMSDETRPRDLGLGLPTLIFVAFKPLSLWTFC